MQNPSEYRYINIYGEPAGRHAWRHFHQSAGMQAGAAMGAFTAVATGASYNFAFGSVLGLGACALAGTMTLAAKAAERSFLSLALPSLGPEQGGPRNPADITIDTLPPGGALPRASDRALGHRLYKQGKVFSALMTGIALGATAWTLGEGQAQGAITNLKEAAMAASFGLAVMSPLAATGIAMTRRFNKIATGEYILTDQPPPRGKKSAPSSIKAALAPGSAP